MTTTGAPQPLAPQRFDVEGAAGRTIRGEARVVPGARASVVLVHGFKGFAHFAFFPYLADRLAAAGLTTLSFNFSGSGVGDDMETFSDPEAFEQNTYTRELHDLGIVMGEGERRGWITARRGLFGHSRGGGIAILRAARDVRVHALATWASISSVRRWPTDVADAWRRRGWLDVENARTKQVFRLRPAVLDEATQHGEGMLDVARAAGMLLCPWLIVHGDADETVSIGEGESLARAAASNAELLRVAGGTHTFNVSHGMTTPSPQLREAVDRTVQFFVDRLLAQAR